jgi:hypothetical protein
MRLRLPAIDKHKSLSLPSSQNLARKLPVGNAHFDTGTQEARVIEELTEFSPMY